MQRLAGQWLKVSTAFFAIISALLLGGCGGKADPTFNISGSWYVFYTTDGTQGIQSFSSSPFSFTQTDNDLTGAVPTSGESLTGSVSGLDISFSFTLNKDTYRYDYNGKVSSDGTTMSGTWSNSHGAKGSWNAIIKLTPYGSIQGNWSLSAPVEGVQGFTFVQSTSDTNYLAGSLTTPQAGPITGVVSNPDILFFWTGSDGTTLYTFSGTLTSKNNGVADVMSGTWTATNGQAGSWSATRSGDIAGASVNIDTGSWYMFYTMTGKTTAQNNSLFSFSQSNNNLTGTVPTTGESLTGFLSGSDVSFSWTSGATSTNSGVKYVYGGNVSSDGTVMSGIWTDSSGDSGIWSSIKQLPVLASVSGSWNLSTPVEGVQGFTFAQSSTDEHDLTGSLTNAQVGPVVGAVGNPFIIFFWTGTDGTTIYSFMGTIDSGTINSGAATVMSGTWTATNGQSGSWSAARS